ncbi:MAG: DUF1501 domain-containing protein, partial [Planctomycetaceae bacterium]|nr:DUF1501 domain-containing protein [Planctomycetaceae bacterium]
MLTRREMLQRTGMGLGSLALAGLLGQEQRQAQAAEVAGSSLAPKMPHFAPRAKRVIHLFMNGGPSQLDTFDPKPALAKYHGQYIDDKLKRDKRLGGVAHASPFKFAKRGQSGIEVSELFPHVSRCIDDLCVIRSMKTDVPNHEP